MRKECRTLCGIFVVIIVFGVTLPVVSQQPDTSPTVLEYTEKVDLSELVKKVDKLSGSIDTLTKNQEPLIKDVGDLKVTIARIDERTGMTFAITIAGIIGILGTIIGGLILQNLSVKKQLNQSIQQPSPNLKLLDQKEQEEQREYKYQTEGAPS